MEKLTPGQARAKHRATFERFWAVYPRKTHINEAQNVWSGLMEQGEDAARLINAAKKFAATQGSDLKYCPAPNNWLRDGRYEDADLFTDQSVALKEWMKQQWRTVNVKAVENKFHITMPVAYPPDDITTADGIRFWHKQYARDWITKIYKEKVECPTSTLTMTEQSVPYLDLFSTTQESSQTSPI